MGDQYAKAALAQLRRGGLEVGSKALEGGLDQ
jgi:hypothetical protein